MGKKASQKDIANMQLILNKLVRYGGHIVTKEPQKWWDFSLEVKKKDEGNKRFIFMGFHKSMDGKLESYWNPQINLVMTMDGKQVVDIEIESWFEKTEINEFIIDSNDVIHFPDDHVEKDKDGIAKRFSDYLSKLIVDGPYFLASADITKYTSKTYY